MTKLFLILAMARIIAGEAPACPLEAKVAVANVMQNRERAGIAGGWYGDREPGAADLAVAWLAAHDRLPQLAPDALYAIGPGDKARMPWLAGAEPALSFACPGTWIELYGVMKITP